MVRRAARIVATLILSVIVVAAVAWAAMALWFDGPHSRVLAGMLAGALILTSVTLAALVRPLLRGLVVALMPVVLVALWWTAIPPSNTRNWTPDVARTVVRRAERLAVNYALGDSLVVAYLNRLSDLVWTMARFAEGTHHRTVKTQD